MRLCRSFFTHLLQSGQPAGQVVELDRLGPDHPLVARADAISLNVVNTPGQEALVELYAGALWEAGMDYADGDDEVSQRCAYICLLKAISRTPIAPPDTMLVCAAFFDAELIAIFEEHMARDKNATPALDPQVRPLLSWLDTTKTNPEQ